METKICVKCKLNKSNKDFYPDKRHIDGMVSRCKECSKEYNREWAREHRSPQTTERSYLWKKNNPIKVKESRLRSKKKNSETQRKWIANNLEYLRLYQREYRSKNPYKDREYNKRKRDTLKGRLNGNLSCSIRKSLRGNKNGKHWEIIVGYSLEQLKKYLEKQFVGGMSWENYGKKGWEIDHIIPIAVFNFNVAEDTDFKRCWSLSNLQPLWRIDNAKKKDKLYKPFQPSLL